MPDPQTIAAILQSVRPAPPIDSSMAGSPAYQAATSLPPTGGPVGAIPGAQPSISDPRIAAILAASMSPSTDRPQLASGTDLRGVLPPSGPFDIASIVHSVAALPEYQKPASQLEDIGQQEKGIQQQLTDLPIPKMGFHPTWAGDMVKAGHPAAHPFLHNLGQALLTAAASTRPGQAVQSTVYGPGIRSYEAQRSQLAARLAALKEQEGVPTEELRSLTGLSNTAGMGMYRGGQLQLGEERNQIAKDRSNTYAEAVSNRNVQGLQRLAQGWQRLNVEQQRQQAQQWYQKAIIETMNTRVAAGMDENSARIQATEDIRAAISKNQWAVNHPVMDWLGFSPDISGAAGAQTPRPLGSTPPPSPHKPTTSNSGTRRVVDLTK